MLKNLVRSALGGEPFDTVVKGGQLVNVYTGEIHPATIGIRDGHFATVADGDVPLMGANVIDATGKHVIPGLIDAHMHIESTMVPPCGFARGVLPRGTTTVCADPHEIGNVLGADGVRMMVENAEGLPLNIYFMAPSTVPSLPGMETPGKVIGPAEIAELLELDGVIGLGEVMDFWGVVELDEKMMGIVETAHSRGALIEGHSPVFQGKELQAFMAAGIDSDHTINDAERVREKLRMGMNVQLQERFITPELMAYLNTVPDLSNLLLVTDDVTADRLMRFGHLDNIVRKAIKMGLDPIQAIQSVTIRAARRMRLYHHGGVAPGLVADLILLDSLEDFSIGTVMAGGKVVAQSGNLTADIPQKPFDKAAWNSVHIQPLNPDDFRIKAGIESGTATVNVVSTNGQTSYTVLDSKELPVKDSRIAVEGSGLHTMAVFERHGAGGGQGLGLLSGIGELKGALASTYAHDCHNLVVIGSNPEDMAAAANALIACGGGVCAVQDGVELAKVPLPIAGLMSTAPIEEISASMLAFAGTMRGMGVVHSEPIMILTILALAVSPEVKITDLGLVDTKNKRFLPLITAEREA